MSTSQRTIDHGTHLDGLAYALSHDLRARLRAASGFLELARADLDGGDEAGYFLERASVAAALADRMTERLVRYMRIDPVDALVVTDPAAAIAEAAARCPAGPEMIVDPLPAVIANHELLTDALVEILDNAARHRREDAPPVVRVSGSVEGDSAILRFTDNGAGISAERVERAFTFFQQVHRVGDSPGSGMGLPIARRSIECQGGTITLQPGPEGGAVVEIRLPAAGVQQTGDRS